VDVVAGTTHPLVSAQVCEVFFREFLHVDVVHALLSVEERTAQSATVQLRHFLQRIKSPQLRVSALLIVCSVAMT
jgi:hypothetical protein